MATLKDLPGVRRAYRSRHVVPIHAFILDRRNRLAYGPQAPRFAERLWIDARSVASFLPRGTVWWSARVRSDWPTGSQLPMDEDPVYRIAVARWRDGLPWEETGEIELLERSIARSGHHDGARTREDILRRCARLDELYRTVERERRILPHGQVVRGAFREMGGIGMHIGPGGEPVRGFNGRHRFAIARLLGLRTIPVRVGLVHRSAIPHLDALRTPPVEAAVAGVPE